MAYALCSKDHYNSGKEGGQCPVATCQGKMGPPIGRTDPDPRGDALAAPEKHSPAACMHFLCREWFPTIDGFLDHFATCPKLSREDRQVYRSREARAS